MEDSYQDINGQEPGSENEPTSLSQLMLDCLEDKLHISLNPFEFAFLSGLVTYTQSEASLRLSEDEIHNVYATLDETQGGLLETRNQRADNLLKRLMEQKLILRLTTFSQEESGIYRMTSLASSIISSYRRQQELTKQSLEELFSQIEVFLKQIAEKAKVAPEDETDWNRGVYSPIRNIVVTLIESIEQRQSGLEQAQIKTQRSFEEMYQNADSLAGIATCERLLSSVADKLKELNRAMMDGAGLLKALILQVEEFSELLNQDKTVELCRYIYESLDQVIEWAQLSGKKWSQYYQNAHEFLRSAIRIDQRRAFAQRLRNNISEYDKDPWQLLICQAPTFVALKEEPEAQELDLVLMPSSFTGESSNGETQDNRVVALRVLLEELDRLAAPQKGEAIKLTRLLKESIPKILAINAEFEGAELKNNIQDQTYHLICQAVSKLIAAGTISSFGHRRDWSPLTDGIEVQELEITLN